MRVQLDIVGDVQLNRELLGVSARGQDMTPAFDRVLDLWIGETAEQFATEGRHASGGWAPLAWSTLQRRRHVYRATRGISAFAGASIVSGGGGATRILFQTGALEHSLTRRNDDGMISRVTPTELEYGTTVPYAVFHQLGTRRMPQRRPVELTEDARRTTVKIIQRFLVTGEVA